MKIQWNESKRNFENGKKKVRNTEKETKGI